MKKNTNQAAFYTRLQELGQVTKPTKKGTINNLGTLIDYRKGADGISFGIVQENHHYYVKKAGLKENPTVSDFTYIGGVENITEYQYKSLAEADKQRNIMLKVINEGSLYKVNENKTKIKQNEDAVDDKIGKIEKKLPDLDAATEKEKEVPAEPVPDFSGADAPPMDGDVPPMGDEMPPMGDEEMPDTDEFNLDEPDNTDSVDNVEGDDNWAEIQKMIGKTTGLIRDSQLEPAQTKSIINSILQSVKKDLPEIEVEDRKEMANKILKTEDNAEADLEQNMPDEEQPVAEGQEVTPETQANLEKIKKANPKFNYKEFIHKHFGGNETDDAFNLDNDYIDESDVEECNECGTFAKYAESRGYNKKSLIEASNDERASVISGYVNAFNEGKNNGDPKMVSIFVNKIIAESLINDYGHRAYITETLKPVLKSLNESNRDDLKKLVNEEFQAVKSTDDSDDFKEAAKSVLADIEKKGTKSDDERKQILIDMLGESINEEEMDEFFNLGNAAKAVGKVFGNKAAAAGNAVGNAVGNAANAVGSGVKNAANAVGNAANAVGSGVKNAANAVGSSVQKVGQEIGQEYNKNQQTSVASSVANIAQELKAKIDQLNAYTVKNGGQPLKYGAVLTSIANQLRSKKGTVDTSRYAANENFTDGMTETQPNLDEITNIENDGEGVEAPAKIAPAFDTMGVGGLSHGTTGIDVNVDAQNKTVNISMNEAKKAIDSLKKAIDEKWSKDVKVKNTGENTDKTVEELKKELATLKKNPNKTEELKSKESKLEFAIRAKQGWKNKIKETITESEGDAKIRNYIRIKLEELKGMRKPMLNENAKSEKLKKLDRLIEIKYNKAVKN